MNKSETDFKPVISISDFILGTNYKDLSPDIIAWAKRCLLDLICVAAAGRKTELSKIIHDHVVDHFGAGSQTASLMFDGRPAGPIGAALAGGMTIDSIDAHDGYKPAKGHIGCALLPSLLSFAEASNFEDGKEFLTRLTIGYEVGSRAAVALHGSVADYHTSGAWMAPTCAGLGARALGLNLDQYRHAIGIAEYHGPRSQMMRVIDHPTMLKDGSGMGAMIGTQAAYLAQSGFTGAPAISFEAPEIAHYWSDLGTRWLIKQQYVKPWPVCRWAQPAAEATKTLLDRHELSHEQIEQITVYSFHEAVRLATRIPSDTEEAQYSLPWPVACVAANGKIGVDEITRDALQNENIRRLANSMILAERDEYNAVFPDQRIADVEIKLKDGTVLNSEATEAKGDPEHPFNDKEMKDKYFAYCHPVIGDERAEQIWNTVQSIEEESKLQKLIGLVTAPIG